MNSKLCSSSSSSCPHNFFPFPTKIKQTEKNHHQPTVDSTPPNMKVKLKVKNGEENDKNSRPVQKRSTESRNRKEPEKGKINLSLSLYDQSWFNIERNKKAKILGPPIAYLGPKKSPEEIRVAKKLKNFSVYTHQEEEEEKILGVSTKLILYDDPWKIRKILTESDCNQLCRLLVGKDLVQQHIIDVWNLARKSDRAAITSKEGIRVKVLDYDREKEYDLTLKRMPSSDCYVFGYNWRSKFVKERNLNKGDEIGLYWSNLHSRLVLSVLARAPAAY